MYKHSRIILCLVVLSALAGVPVQAAQLTFVAGTIVTPEFVNEGDMLAGGTVVKTGADGLAMVEHRWPSDVSFLQCVQIVIFGYGQSYTVRTEETPGRCETTVPTSPGNFREGEAFLAKETRYGDAAFDVNEPDKVHRSRAQWRGFDQWTRNAVRRFTGDVVDVGGGRIRVRSPKSGRQMSFTAESSSVDSPVALNTLVDKRVRVDYKGASFPPQAIRIRLVSPSVTKPSQLSSGVIVGGSVPSGGKKDLGTGKPPSGKKQPSEPSRKAQTEVWVCTVDLHQGDTGTMEFTRRGTEIQGAMLITRGSQKHAISGAWEGDDINFWRALSKSSGQPFRGTVSKAGGEVRMAGRFANQYQGVWSADCKLQLGQGAAPLPDAGGERYNVVLTGYGESKVSVIKVFRAVTGIGLRNSKEAVESTPYTVKAGVSVVEARRIAEEFKRAGGDVRIELQP